MSEWKKYKFSDIAEVIKDIYSPNVYDEINYIGLEHIEQETLRLNSVGKSKDVTSNKFLFQKNDVLFGKLRVYFRKVVKPKFDGICSTDIWVLRAKEGFDQDFLFNFVANWDFINLADSGEGGTRMPRADWDFIKNTVWKVPQLPEQKAIAAILSSLDDKIDLLHRQNATLEKMAETLFRKCFIEDAKEEWKSGRVGDLIRILSGFAFKSSSFVESGKYRLITIKGVQDGYLELTNSNRIDELPEQMPEFCKLQIGDILLSLTGNVGRCCLVDTTYLLLNQRVAKLHPIKERDKAFTYFFFRQPKIKQLLEDMAKGTAQANLSPIETSNMELKIPDDYTLNEFSSLVTPWLEKLIFNKKSIQTLTKIRDSLLPKLMSGEVTVEMP